MEAADGAAVSVGGVPVPPRRRGRPPAVGVHYLPPAVGGDAWPASPAGRPPDTAACRCF